MNVPNIISMIRVLLIPVMVIFLMDGDTGNALVIFLIAALSDGVDGLIARVFHQRTVFGAYLDPIADKLLIGASFITMAIINLMPGWLAVLVISRDIIIITGIGILFLNDKKIEMKPSIDSKLNTLVQLMTICYFLALNRFPQFAYLKYSLLFITSLVTVFSGMHYIIIGFTLLGNNKKNI